MRALKRFYRVNRWWLDGIATGLTAFGLFGSLYIAYILLYAMGF